MPLQRKFLQRAAKKYKAFTCQSVRHASRFPPLPRVEKWKTKFPMSVSRGRVTLKNQETAQRVAEAFLPKNQEGSSSEGKIVIEAFPGPGLLTRSLLSLSDSRVSKLIVLEEEEMFLEHLTELEKRDSRVKVVPLSGHSWATYDTLEVEGILKDVGVKEWNELSDLHFIAHIPHTVAGDQLIAQLFRCIPDKSWLFKYGRVPMSFLLDQNLWQRVCSAPGDQQRCKLSVIAEASSDFSLCLPPTALLPNFNHFFPSARNSADIRNPRITRPVVAVTAIPKLNPAIDGGMLDKWDYVLRRLFVLKSTALKKALPSLAPGASNLIKPISSFKKPPDERVDPNKTIKKLDLKDWAIIMKAFDDWPFAPEDLAITDTFHRDLEKD